MPDSPELVDLEPGQIIRTDALPELAEVRGFQRMGSRYRLEVILQVSRVARQMFLNPDQATSIEIVGSETEALMDPLDFFLGLEAYRIRLAHQFDPLLALSTSKVEPLPHQIEAVYDHALASPRMRFMIADDPGAGKTIMAGLIIRELQFRQRIKRILVVAPGHLKYQWQREMDEKFGLRFQIMDRNRMNSASGENPWVRDSQLIASMDFAKQPDVRATLQGVRWDLVIVDEAHKMSASIYEGREETRIEKTQRYQLGEVLSRNCDQLLFLTATPHRGEQEGFRLFLNLLRPGFFVSAEMIAEAVQRGDNPLFIRRLKEDMKDFEGRPIFPPRHVQSIEFRLSDAERDLYNGVTRYVQDYFNMAQQHRHISFAMMILQRRLSSSANAILTSLQRRKDKLREILRNPEARREYLGIERRIPDREEYNDLPEDEREKVEREAELFAGSSTVSDIQEEIRELYFLIEEAEVVRAQEVEAKLVALRDKILTALGDRKLLIFTEFTDTLEYLEEKLLEWGYSVCKIHGGMSMEERLEAERVFRDEAQIMVATEAAGEGINLQFCSVMANYDIPWNPNRLEQRMGRIHRYGQQREVYIWNMISYDTREGQVMKRLFEKLDQMRDDLGDRVFDVVNELIPGTALEDMIMGAIWGQRTMDEIEATMEQLGDGTAKDVIEQIAGKALATQYIDYSGLLEKTQLARENRLVPEYVEDFFLRAAGKLELRVEERQGGYTITWVPHNNYREYNDDPEFTSRHGRIAARYNWVTFDESVSREYPRAQYVAPGHPLLEATVESLIKTLRQGALKTVFEDPNRNLDGTLWFLEGAIMDGTGEAAGRKVFCLYRTDDDEIREISPAVLWDLEPAADGGEPHAATDFTGEDEVVTRSIALVMEPFEREISARRVHEAQVKERYGLRSLNEQIGESQSKLLEYESRADQGEAMQIVIYNERQRTQEMETRRVELEKEIRLRRNVTIELPQVLGVALVIPAPVDKVADLQGHITTDDLRPEVEAVGMQVTMAYERQAGREPEDVSDKNYGYDVRSTRYRDDGTIEVRYIEVKGRARSGGIRLTANEWKMARKLGEDFWLYVITDALGEAPQLRRINDPASHFREEEDIFATGFVVPEEAWQSKGEAVTNQ